MILLLTHSPAPAQAPPNGNWGHQGQCLCPKRFVSAPEREGFGVSLLREDLEVGCCTEGSHLLTATCRSTSLTPGMNKSSSAGRSLLGSLLEGTSTAGSRSLLSTDLLLPYTIHGLLASFPRHLHPPRALPPLCTPRCSNLPFQSKLWHSLS